MKLIAPGNKHLSLMKITAFSLAIGAGLIYPTTILYWVMWLVVAGLEIFGFIFLKERALINLISLILSVIYVVFMAFFFIGL